MTVRVRIVEDDVAVAALLRHVLTGDGLAVVDHVVTTAGLYDPSAWDDVDVLVTDVMLEGSPTDGGHLATWVLEHTDTAAVVITAGRVQATRAAAAAGARVLLKPFDLDQLLDTIREAT